MSIKKRVERFRSVGCTRREFHNQGSQTEKAGFPLATRRVEGIKRKPSLEEQKLRFGLKGTNLTLGMGGRRKCCSGHDIFSGFAKCQNQTERGWRTFRHAQSD